ncbi:MAG: hypothetical protein ACTSUE_25700 [Promethearchaeota archaeon]
MLEFPAGRVVVIGEMLGQALLAFSFLNQEHWRFRRLHIHLLEMSACVMASGSGASGSRQYCRGYTFGLRAFVTTMPSTCTVRAVAGPVVDRAV